MSKLNLEDVFTLSGVPEYTYVVPQEYMELKVALRTHGRGVIVEGPSGIGKTTAIVKLIDELGLDSNCLLLTARKADDVALIREIINTDGFETIIIDDFHRLPNDLKKSISDKMKTMADEGVKKDKLVLVGINRAGDSLVQFSPDLNNRIDTIHFEKNDDIKIIELIEKGEVALNIELKNKTDIVDNSYGSFHIAQMLCQKTCILGNVDSTCDQKTVVECIYAKTLASIFEELSRIYYEVASSFSTGTKLRKEGRAPYLHILYWLAKSNEWSLSLPIAMIQHPKQKASVSQVVEKGYLEQLIESKSSFTDYMHYDSSTKILTIEDPKFVFFLRNIDWSKFAHDIGFISFELDNDASVTYDIALSFAGANRTFAQALFDKLSDRELAVFYDYNERVDILAQDVEEYLFPIYESRADFVVPLLSSEYPKRIWTKFESQAFKHRFGENRIIPIWYSDTDENMFDESRKYGGIVFDVSGNINAEIEKITDLLCKKIENHKISAIQ